MHRPPRSLRFEKVVEGLRLLKEEQPGEVWAELMLVGGVNDSLTSLLSIRRTLKEIAPDRLYVAVPTRPPAEDWVLPPTKESLRQVFDIFPEARDMTEPEEGPFLRNEGEREEEIVQIAMNHPLREDQALELLAVSMGPDGARESLARMVQDGKLVMVQFEGRTFYQVPSERVPRKR